ncbi:MAG: hypothetical protein K2X77_09600 [Candidatus Obscuribacterales bacterium]|nr:hypothetical protein [Candidatus Obscuribacterales bacterium]
MFFSLSEPFLKFWIPGAADPGESARGPGTTNDESPSSFFRERLAPLGKAYVILPPNTTLSGMIILTELIPCRSFGYALI